MESLEWEFEALVIRRYCCLSFGSRAGVRLWIHINILLVVVLKRRFSLDTMGTTLTLVYFPSGSSLMGLHSISELSYDQTLWRGPGGLPTKRMTFLLCNSCLSCCRTYLSTAHAESEAVRVRSSSVVS